MSDRERPISASSSPAPEDMHWGINYLREDLQDIRLDIREIRVEMQGRFAEMQKRMDSRFFWTLGFMATLIAINAAFMTALIKL